MAARSVKTVGSLVADLDEAFALARDCRAPGAMVAAVMGQGKLVGLIVDKLHHHLRAERAYGDDP